VYRFSENVPEILYEVSIVKDVKHPNCSSWSIELRKLLFILDNEDSATAHIASEEWDDSPARTLPKITWKWPCPGHYDLLHSRHLPCVFSWTNSHLYVVFGSIEVKICRIELFTTPETTEPRKIQVLKESVFLPSSAIERGVEFIPRTVSGVEYAVFALGGNDGFAPALLWRETEKDLGGWIAYDKESGLSVLETMETADFIKGEYACPELRFDVPIRSGLSWNHRSMVTCW
jgi:hypothetical protein